MAANNHTHSFANITPVDARLVTVKRVGNENTLLVFDCTGPRNATGVQGQYRFTIRLNGYKAARLRTDLSLGQ